MEKNKITKVRNIYSNLNKSFRSFEIKEEMKPEEVFSIVVETIGAWTDGAVSNEPIIESKDPLIIETYFYVLNQRIDLKLNHQEQLVIRIRIDAGKKVAMIYVAAELWITVIGILTHVWELVNTSIAKRYDFEFKSLRCPECGGSIENMKSSHNFLKCNHCNQKIKKSMIT